MPNNNFPSWRFHAFKPACTVNNEDEDAALGPGWYKSPADVMPDVTAEPAPPEVEPGPVTVNEEPTPPDDEEEDEAEEDDEAAPIRTVPNKKKRRR